jgi:hypothetical protein
VDIALAASGRLKPKREADFGWEARSTLDAETVTR